MAHLLLTLALFVGSPALAGGKKQPEPEPVDGKRVVEVKPFDNYAITMPDENLHYFGQDFEAKLKTLIIESPKLILFNGVPELSKKDTPEPGNPPEYQWRGTSVPTARIDLAVHALSFRTGFRGTRMFYGFDERMYTPFNDGWGTLPNEFPLKDDPDSHNWFERRFDPKGFDPFTSQTGLDIGEEVDIDVMMGRLGAKYASYRAELRMDLKVEVPFQSGILNKPISVVGTGYFVDVIAGYQGYVAGLKIARKDAMLQAVNKARDAAFKAIEETVASLPLTGRIDFIVNENDGNTYYLLGTGHHSGVIPGTRYDVEDTGAVLEVLYSNESGSVAKLVQGNPMDLYNGQLLLESTSSEGPLALGDRWDGSAIDIEIPPEITDFVEEAMDLFERVKDILEQVWEVAFVGYRVYRFFSYDQEYKYEDDLEYRFKDENRRQQELEGAAWSKVLGPKNVQGWHEYSKGEQWAKQIELEQAPEMGSASTPVVAIIDSGMDYNHRFLWDGLWMNPGAITDASGNTDRYGFDFISGDAKAFDDTYHGTQLASMVLAVAPKAKILPVKVFNPWGITSSAALLTAHEYAVNQGAHVILSAWATRKHTQTITMALDATAAADTAVVTTAGDWGSDLAIVPTFPGSLASDYDNLIAVASVDEFDGLVNHRGKHSGFGLEDVSIAAPGKNVLTALPRNMRWEETSTRLSAAMVAGALARVQARSSHRLSSQELFQGVYDQAFQVESLRGKIQNGRRLRIKH